MCLCSLVPSPTPSFSSLAVRLRYCKRRKAGRGTGNEARVYNYLASFPGPAHGTQLFIAGNKKLGRAWERG